MAAFNCNGYLTRWAGMMNWLVKEEFATCNPVRGLRIADPIPAREKRLPFSIDQLGAIFQGEPYTDLRVKTASSERVIPAHPALIRARPDIRTMEGFTYLAVVIDLYSRRVEGWSIQSRQTTDVVLQALHMTVWRRKPKHRVLIHSDQGSQFTSMDWVAFIRAHNLEHSMSRRGNCHDNAVAESFFSSLQRERIRRRAYKNRKEARQDVFDYIEMFYNPARKQVRNGMLSPVEFERQQIWTAENV